MAETSQESEKQEKGIATDDPYFVSAPKGLSALGAIVRAGDPDRFEASLLAPAQTREALFALYGFNLEIARAPWRSAEPHIALMRLQFWRDVIRKAVAGETAAAHEIAEPLHALIQAGFLTIEHLEAMIAAREMEVGADGHFSADAFEHYLAQSGGALLAAALEIALARSLTPDEAERAQRLGQAGAYARLLEATPYLAAQGKVLLPLTREDRALLLGGETSDGARAVIAERATFARAILRAARRADWPRAARPALLSQWRAERILKNAAVPTLDIFADLGPESPARRRISLLWRSLVG